MYDIKQFKPALYVVVVLGLCGYAPAAESPGLWVFALAMVLANAYLLYQGTFRPMPRVVANGVTLLAFCWAFLQIRHTADSPILAIGQFLVLLQIVKVWEQRANRDYAQLLVLSLLLMVAAAISTASLAFGLMFVAYLLASLYCCLLFHLKVETDEARASLTPAAAAALTDRSGPADNRRLAASMRRLTGLVAAYALVSAVLVFLFFPRGPGAGMFGNLVWRPAKAQTGFSEQVNFQQVAQITQNNDQVATVRLVHPDGRPVTPTGPLLLRGLTDDYYSGSDDAHADASYQWTHAPDVPRGRWRDMTGSDNGTWRPRGAGPEGADGADAAGPDGAADGIVRQEVNLSPTGTQALFTLAGVTQVHLDDPTFARRLILQYRASDGTVRANDALRDAVRYTVDSTGSLGNEPPPAHQASNIDRAIKDFARRPDVTGGLAARRDAEVAARPDRGLNYVSPLDALIATRVESYLRHNYAYTLDLTDVARVQGRDPMVAFLTDFKKGHCEYFAGAMTLMCQSLGMQARLVIGFKCDDYNDYGHYYTVRQSQAHAWVEVRTDHGWASYDPTSGNEVAVAGLSPWQKTKHFLDYLEYTWQRSVITYNSDNRANLIEAMNTKLTASSYRGPSVVDYHVRDAVEGIGNWTASHVVGPLIAALAVGLLGAVGWFAAERVRLRRRASRIGLDDLPPDAQARLVRQLAFYDALVQLLGRHGIVRPPHLTPREFGDRLAFLPANAYDTVRRLTGLFYRIRFGGAGVDDGRQRRLMTVVGRLEGMLGGNAE